MSTIRNNLKLNACSQYRFDYNSLCLFNGTVIGARSDGLFKVGIGELDSSAEIDSEFTLHLSNFGLENPKRLRRMYLGFEATGNLNVTLVTDKKETFGPALVTVDLLKGQQRRGITFERMHWFEYATIKIENVSGCFFALDSIEIMPIIGHYRRK